MTRLASLVLSTLVVGFLLGLALIGHAQERIVLTTPVQSAVGAKEFRVWMLQLQRTHPDSQASIVALFRETVTGVGTFVPGGRIVECRFSGATADSLISALNITNLAANSLEKLVTLQCQGNGALGAGVITGSPQ